MILTSPVEEIVIIPDGFYYNKGLVNAEQFVGRKRVKILNLDPHSDEDNKDVNTLGLDLIFRIESETQYINNLGDFYGAARSFHSSQENLLT